MELLASLTTASWDVLLALAPWLFLGAVVAGLLHGLVPPELIHRRLRGLSGVAVSYTHLTLPTKA